MLSTPPSPPSSLDSWRDRSGKVVAALGATIPGPHIAPAQMERIVQEVVAEPETHQRLGPEFRRQGFAATNVGQAGAHPAAS